MAAFLVKRRIWIGLGAVALLLALTALVSVIAGNRIISSGLQTEFETLTGRRLVYAGDPVITIFPALSAEFHDVSLHDWKNASDGHPILKVPVMRLSLSAYAALKNQVRVTGIILEKPVFYANELEGGLQFPISSQSRLAKLLAAIDTSLPDLENSEGVVAAREHALGTIKVNQGSIVFDEAGGAKTNADVTAIDATLSWFLPGFMGSLTATGNWRGETTTLEMETSDAVLMLAGVNTSLNAKLGSKLLNMQFSGTSRLLPNPYFDGRLFAETSSLAKISSWQNIDVPIGMDDLGLTISGELKADADKWQLEDSELQLGTNKGRGALTFQPAANPPSLTGTMDFDVLDLAITVPLFEAGGQNHQPGETAPTAVDLRISADTASIGPLVLRNVAASLQLTQEASALDINDASLFGGTMQLALKSENAGAFGSAKPQSELRVLANNIDTKMLTNLGGIFKGWPEARGTVSAILRGPRANAKQFFDTADGTVKLRLADGILPGFDGARLIAKLREGGFIALNPEPPAVLAFTEVNAEAILAGGTLQIDPLRIGLAGANIELSGAYALNEDSLALTGKIDLEEGPASPTVQTIKIFIGGNRHAPLMSALPDGNPIGKP